MTYHYLNLAGLSLGVTGKPVQQFFPRLTMREIQRVVAEHYEIHESDMRSAERTRSISRPRQVAMYLSRELTKASYPSIAARFNKRDHTTVLFAVEQVQKRIGASDAYAREIAGLRERLAR